MSNPVVPLTNSTSYLETSVADEAQPVPKRYLRSVRQFFDFLNQDTAEGVIPFNITFNPGRIYYYEEAPFFATCPAVDPISTHSVMLQGNGATTEYYSVVHPANQSGVTSALVPAMPDGRGNLASYYSTLITRNGWVASDLIVRLLDMSDDDPNKRTFQKVATQVLELNVIKDWGQASFDTYQTLFQWVEYVSSANEPGSFGYTIDYWRWLGRYKTFPAGQLVLFGVLLATVGGTIGAATLIPWLGHVTGIAPLAIPVALSEALLPFTAAATGSGAAILGASLVQTSQSVFSPQTADQHALDLVETMTSVAPEPVSNTVNGLGYLSARASASLWDSMMGWCLTRDNDDTLYAEVNYIYTVTEIGPYQLFWIGDPTFALPSQTVAITDGSMLPAETPLQRWNTTSMSPWPSLTKLAMLELVIAAGSTYAGNDPVRQREMEELLATLRSLPDFPSQTPEQRAYSIFNTVAMISNEYGKSRLRPPFIRSPKEAFQQYIKASYYIWIGALGGVAGLVYFGGKRSYARIKSAYDKKKARYKPYNKPSKGRGIFSKIRNLF